MPAASRLLRAGHANWTASPLSYPSAANTGPAPGTSFTTVGTGPGQISADPGGAWVLTAGASPFVNITGSGTSGSPLVISGLSIPYPVSLNSTSYVTLENCVVTTPAGVAITGVGFSHTTSCAIRNCTVSGTDATAGRANEAVSSVHGDDVAMLVQGCNLFWSRIGVNIAQGTLLDNYIHDPGYQAGDHIDGVSCLGTGRGTLLIRHNTILVGFSQTSPIDTGSTQSTVQDMTVDNNLLGGGGYAIYCGFSNGSTRTDTNGTGGAVVSVSNTSATVSDSRAVASDLGLPITSATSGAIPAGTVIIGVSAGTGYTLSQPATGAATTVTVHLSYGTRTDTASLSTTTGSSANVANAAANANDMGASITTGASGAIPSSQQSSVTSVVTGVGYTIFPAPVSATSPASITLGWTKGVVVTNNRITGMYYPTGGLFGPGTAFDSVQPTNIWANNVYHDDPSATPIAHP